MRLKSTFTYIVVFFCALSFSTVNVPFGERFKGQIEQKFFNQGKLSHQKITSYQDSIEQRLNEIINIEFLFERDDKGRSEHKAMEKALENDSVKNLKLLLSIIEELKKEEDKLSQYLKAETILDLDNAIKSEITPVNSNLRLVKGIAQFFEAYEIKKGGVESSNLINPATGEFLSQRELRDLQVDGLDLSNLNPPEENGVIELIDDIENVDVKDRYEEGGSLMHKGLHISWPAKNVGELVKIRKTQSRPKIIFKSRDRSGEEKEWKLKMLMEIHSEPTAASLASALGLYVDISKHVKQFKIYLGKDTFDEFSADFATYFELEDLHHVIEQKGKDEKGEFIIIKEGMLEARFPEEDLNRVGPYYPTSKKGKRETRAWQIFNLWINNTDLKPGENNKLVARNIDGELRLFGFQHDLGYAFGNWQREKPTNFKWNLIKKKNKKKIVFDFHSFVLHEGWDHLTFSDGKWMARKIARLSREQIASAVRLGKWPNKAPYNYEALLIEKLISRRNDLVKAFELEGEILPSGKTIELLPFSKDVEKEAIPTNEFIEGHTVDFREEVKLFFIHKQLEALNSLVKVGVKGILAGLDEISLDPVWFGIDQNGLLIEALTHFDRTVVENPDAKGENDQFIVRDDFSLGIRLGKGTGLDLEKIGDSAYIRKYSLIYPAASKEQAEKRSKFVVDLAMPYRILKRGLPRKHIFITENYVEGRTRVETPSPTGIGVGYEAIGSKLLLNRTVLAHKEDGDVLLFDDSSSGLGREGEVHLDLGLFKLKQFSSTTESGEVNRSVYKLKYKKNNEQKVRAIDMAVLNHDFSELKKYAKKENISSDYIEKDVRATILGFRTWEKGLRVDDLQIYKQGKDNKLILDKSQVNGVLKKERSWKFLKNGENKYQKIEASFRGTDLDHPIIEVSVVAEDLNTVTSEITSSYFPFFHGLTGDDRFFSFTPELHSYNKNWGQLNFSTKLKYHDKAYLKLSELSEDQVINALAKIINLDQKEIREAWNAPIHRRMRGVPRNSRNVSIEYFGKKYSAKSIISRLKSFLSYTRSSKKEENKRKSVEKLMKGISQLVPNKGAFFGPIPLRVINTLVGESNFHLVMEMKVPKEKELENKLPGRIQPYFELGTKPKKNGRNELISLSDSIKLYDLMLD